MYSRAGRGLVLLTEQTSKSRTYDNKMLGLRFQDNAWLSNSLKFPHSCLTEPSSHDQQREIHGRGGEGFPY